MPRERIKSQNNNSDNRHLLFKSIGLPTKGLFGNSTKGLSNRDRDYLITKDQILNFINGKAYTEITLKQLSHFFLVQYEFIYKVECIDYNWFNFQTTMKKLKDYTGYSSWVEMAWFLYQSIDKSSRCLFENVPNIITLSVFKRSWLVDELLDKSPKFSSFY